MQQVLCKQTEQIEAIKPWAVSIEDCGEVTK